MESKMEKLNNDVRKMIGVKPVGIYMVAHKEFERKKCKSCIDYEKCKEIHDGIFNPNRPACDFWFNKRMKR